MKKSATKIAFLFGLYIALHFMVACDPACDCDPVDFPFFDYADLMVTNNDPSVDTELNLYVTPTQISLLAVDEPLIDQFNFISTAWGCECLFNGSSGPKFPVTSLNIFADRAFDDLHPVDSSLTSLFMLNQYDPPNNRSYSISAPTFYIGNYNTLLLTTTNRPKNQASPIRFTLQFIKSNNDTITIQTDTIRFQ